MTKLIVAVDTKHVADAMGLIHELDGLDLIYKFGLEFFTANGPQGVAAVANHPIFLDLKFYDTPETTREAVLSALALEPTLLTVHAATGPTALEEIAGIPHPGCKLIAVTVLTSLDNSDMFAMGLPDVGKQVEKLSVLADQCGLDGVVCAVGDVPAIRAATRRDFITVCPGIRPAGLMKDDHQKRVYTPAEAVMRDADYIVVGRPIWHSANRRESAQAILDQLT